MEEQAKKPLANKQNDDASATRATVWLDASRVIAAPDRMIWSGKRTATTSRATRATD